MTHSKDGSKSADKTEFDRLSRFGVSLMSFLSLECVYKIITLKRVCLRFMIWRKIIIWRIFDILFDQNIFTSLNKKYFQLSNFKLKKIQKSNFKTKITLFSGGFLVTFSLWGVSLEDDEFGYHAVLSRVWEWLDWIDW